jgi:hypothetical protein
MNNQLWSIVLLSVADLFGWVTDVVGWLGGAAAWIVAQIPAAAWAVAVVIALGIVAGFAIRRVRLLWLMRSPRVQISEFTWTGKKDDERDGVWFTARFRDQLVMLQANPLDPLPERSPSTPLVDVVEGVSQGVSGKADVGKAAGRLFRAIWPVAAYEVWGTLRPLEDDECLISVQLIDRTRGNRSLVSASVLGRDWRRGARQAAMAVGGGLYPFVAKKHRGPWTRWSKPLPPELVNAYHKAQRLDEEDRLAEALNGYHEALLHDPLNPELRLKIAMLQERLALDLDAWVTYLAIVTETDRKAWVGAERRTRFVALYRLAVLLNNGRIATQWVEDATDGEQETEHDKERWKLRNELMISMERDPWLTGRPSNGGRAGVSNASATELLSCLPDRPSGEMHERREWLRELLLTERIADGSNRAKAARRERIEALLQVMSLRRLEELEDWLRATPPALLAWRWHWLQWREWCLHRPPLRQWLRRRDLSRSVIRVSQLFARIHIAASTERRRVEAGKSTADIRSEHRALTSAWPFPPAGNWRRPFPPDGPRRALARWIAPRRRWANGRSDSWQLHYNAACAVASVLVDSSVLSNARRDDEESPALPGTITQEHVVRRAVYELEEYAHRAGTEKVGEQADWIAYDDPDLRGLHSQDAFKIWASHHLPLDLPEERPERSLNVERYTARMLKEAARVFADVWRERAEQHEPAATEVAAWWRVERDAWRRVAAVCREHRSWKQRLDALKALREWLRSQDKEGRIDFGHEARHRTVEAKPVTSDLFAEMAMLLGKGPPRRRGLGPTTALRWAERRSRRVERACDGKARLRRRRAPARWHERRQELKAARIWTRLADMLKGELNGEPAGRAATGEPWASLKPVRKELSRSVGWTSRSVRESLTR